MKNNNIQNTRSNRAELARKTIVYLAVILSAIMLTVSLTTLALMRDDMSFSITTYRVYEGGSQMSDNSISAFANAPAVNEDNVYAGEVIAYVTAEVEDDGSITMQRSVDISGANNSSYSRSLINDAQLEEENNSIAQHVVGQYGDYTPGGLAFYNFLNTFFGVLICFILPIIVLALSQILYFAVFRKEEKVEEKTENADKSTVDAEVQPEPELVTEE